MFLSLTHMYSICSGHSCTLYHMPAALLLSAWLWGPFGAPCRPHHSSPVGPLFCLRPGSLLSLYKHNRKDKELASWGLPQPVGDKSQWTNTPVPWPEAISHVHATWFLRGPTAAPAETCSVILLTGFPCSLLLLAPGLAPEATPCT